MIPVPQSVLAALAQAYGTKAVELSQFGGGEESSDGVIYAFPDGETSRLLKIMAIPAAERRVGLLSLQERLKFVRFLGENGANIVFPRLSPQQNLYETTFAANHLWIGYSMEVAPGRTMPNDAWEPEMFRNWGQAIGLNHRLAQQYPTWRTAVDPEGEAELLTWRGEWQGFYEWCQDDEVQEQWVAIKQQLDALPVTRDSFGFIHNDPHIWNLLVQGDRVTLLDFDVANHHWFINDVAIACQHVLAFLAGGMGGPVYDRHKLQQFLRLFKEGYRREHQLAAEWWDRLDLFIAYRRILMFIVMNDWIRSQPQLHASWKQMILSQPTIVDDA